MVKITFVLFLMILCSAYPVTSLPSWKLLGLESERVSAIVVDPFESQVLFAGSRGSFSAGTTGGIFKSTNGGAVWDTLMRGLAVADIALDPVIPGIVYVASSSPLPGLFKSTNSGADWFSADSGIYLDYETGAISVLIDPTRPNSLYCGTGGFQGGGLYKTTNGGEWWFPVHCDSISYPPTPCDVLLGGVISLALVRSNPDTLYAGTAGSGFIVKTTDGGENWEFTGYTNSTLPYVISIDPYDPERLFAGVWQNGLQLSTDGGSTWTRVLNGLPDTSTNMTSISINSQNPDEIYCAAGGIPINDVFYSLDGGKNWASAGFPEDVNLFYGALAVSVGNQTVLAGGDSGIFRMGLLSSVHVEDEVRARLIVNQNYPNPFNHSTIISFYLPAAQHVHVSVYDVAGRLIATVFSGTALSGDNSVEVDSGSLSSGIYLYRVQTRRETFVRKMALIR